MNVNTRVITNGQAATTGTTILTPDQITNSGGIVDIKLFNNNAAAQTVTLTVAPGVNSTVTTNVGRWVLNQYERVRLSNIQFGAGDTVILTTTTASALDYTVSQGSGGPELEQVFDANGALKQVNRGVSGNQTVSGTLTAAGLKLSGGLLNIGPSVNDTYGATVSIDVTKSNHNVLGVSSTSATATYNASAAGNDGDILIITTAADASGGITITLGTNFKKTATQVLTASHWGGLMFKSDGTEWVEIGRATNSN